MFNRRVYNPHGGEGYTGKDSLVRIPHHREYVEKHYPVHRFSIDDIRRYSRLHTILAEAGSLQLPYEEQDVTFLDLHFSDPVEVSFLDIGQDIRGEQSVIVHKIPYVSGETLADAQGKKHFYHPSALLRKDFVLVTDIKKRIFDHIAQLTGLKALTPVLGSAGTEHIVEVNIKVVSQYTPGVAPKLIVTDIGADIRRLLDQNSDILDSLRIS